MIYVIELFVLLSSLAAPSAAWGNLGHMTVGAIAQDFVTADTASWARGILNASATNSSYLASVATWADSFRYTSEGHYSAPYHFIDAKDSPPNSCSVDYNRDCGSDGCSVSAIANYTQRVTDGRLSAENTQEALKFLVHLLGDITQPLHDEALELGGNEIGVTFDGTKTNLHHIWDTNMPEKLIGGDSLTDAMDWAKNLTTAIKTGDYASQKDSWIKGMDTDDVVTSAMVWATDANTFVCNPVLKGGESAVDGKELGTDYYEAAVPIINEQIAKGGYRLAAWLNLIHTGSAQLVGKSAAATLTADL
ncbi:MAG: hypothetical protein M1828_002651 [Chrysothrix sp. TS-e1954]|nr:MAG: hypothetical protein M1828_002651 [Chrysothrix sp. TS-e1954]